MMVVRCKAMAGETGRFANFGRKVDEKVKGATPHVEQEVQRVIRYLNDEVVPGVRKNSSAALRSASQQLGHLAEWLDQARSAPDAAEEQRWGAGQEEGAGAEKPSSGGSEGPR